MGFSLPQTPAIALEQLTGVALRRRKYEAGRRSSGELLELT
jgi:hypothetical protein